MVVQLETCRVHFPEWYDDRAEWEAEAKGWLPEVQVELADGHRYPVTFFDPVRLGQDLELSSQHGCPVVAETALVVIPEVTRAAILRAAPELIREHFFDHLKPLPAPAVNGAPGPAPSSSAAGR